MNKKLFTGICVALLLANPAFTQRLQYHKDSLQGLSLSIERFNELLRHSLADSAVGWAYCIWHKGRPAFEAQGGYKITPADKINGTGVAFETSTRMHIASLSKSITALAIAKLVELKKLDWDAPAKNYLPSYWKYHPSFSQLTIRTLLAMKSGLNAPLDQFTSSLDSLRVLIERGPDSTKVGRFNYQNTGYGLLRIIIAYAGGYKEFSDKEDTRAQSAAIANSYKNFVNNHILQPAGVPAADCRMTDDEPALSYPFPYHGEHGELTGAYDLSEYAGGFGWYLSAKDVVKLIDAVMNKRKIITTQILDQLFGIEFPFIIRNGKYGNYFGSGGDWGHPVPGSGWKGIHTFFYCFPDDLVAVVFVNSGEGSPSRKIIAAYRNSFQ